MLVVVQSCKSTQIQEHVGVHHLLPFQNQLVSSEQSYCVLCGI